MTLTRLNRRALGCLDVLAILSLFGTEEVRPSFLAVAAGIGALRLAVARGGRFREGIIRARPVFLALLVAVVAFGVAFARLTHLPPAVGAAHMAVLLHATLWLGPHGPRDRVLRLGMGFIDLVLASVLTPVAYMFLGIFAFAILGSVYISSGFLEASFGRRAPELLEQPLPGDYLRSTIILSLAVFFCSLVLFPIIPRGSWMRPLEDRLAAQVGYTEGVDLAQAQSRALQRSTAVAFRVIRLGPASGDGGPAGADFPLGLFRGRSLDRLDGSRWIPSYAASSRKTKPAPPAAAPAPAPPEASTAAHDRFDAVAEPALGGARPLPYRGRVLSTFYEARKLHYTYEMNSSPRAPLIERPEPPLAVHLELPPEYRTPRLEGLAQRLFQRAQDPVEKIGQLKRFFTSGAFHGSTAAEPYQPGQPGALPGEPASIGRRSAALLENFLFRERTGTCESFATAAAVLLRIAKVPTRVVAGFRTRQSFRDRLLTIPQNDAHAWLEYWDPARSQWIPYDPTPWFMDESWYAPVADFFWNAYWASENIWYRYILDYGARDNASGAAPAPVSPSAGGTATPSHWAGWEWAERQLDGWNAADIALGLGSLAGFVATLLILQLRFAGYADWLFTALDPRAWRPARRRAAAYGSSIGWRTVA